MKKESISSSRDQLDGLLPSSGKKPMNEPPVLNDANTRKVGYRNPPASSRFRKGQSGNPRGRPKGSLNVATVLGRILRERVIITENGKRKKVTKLEIAISQLIDKAAAGDLKAVQLLTTLARSTEERDIQAHIPVPRLEEVDEKIVQGILKRFEIARRGAKKDETDT